MEIRVQEFFHFKHWNARARGDTIANGAWMKKIIIIINIEAGSFITTETCVAASF